MPFLTNGQLKAHSHWNHTGNGAQTKKKQEDIVAKAFQEDGLSFQRSHFVSHSCSSKVGAHENGEGKQTWALHDLMIHGVNTVIFVEIDEHQHRHYGTSCEVSRMAKTVESLRCDGNSSAIYFIHCNPATHTCKVNGIRQVIDEKKSLRALCTLVRSFVDKRERQTVYTIYFNYGSEERTSSNMYLKDLKTLTAIFDDDDYQHSVKEWLFVNVTPEDYMNIHVVQLDDSGKQSSVMKIDDLGDEITVFRDDRPTNYSTPSEVLRVQEKMGMIKDSNPLTLKDIFFVLTGQPKYMIRSELGDSKERKTKELNVYITDEDDGLFLLIAGGAAALQTMVAQEKAGLV